VVQKLIEGMHFIYNFYDKLFLYYYNLKKNDDDSPEYFPIIIVSTGQAVNIFFFVILLFYFLEIQFSFLPKIYLALHLGMVVFNYYLYEIKGRIEVLLKKNINLSMSFKVFSYIYFAISISSPFILIYFIQEYLM
jgi:hypothetical protein